MIQGIIDEWNVSEQARDRKIMETIPMIFEQTCVVNV